MDWFDIFECARAVLRRRKKEKDLLDGRAWITAEDLAEEAQLPDGETATAAQTASAWLAKFCNWAYLKRFGKEGRRRVYVITDWGARLKRPDPMKGKKGKE